MAAVGGFSMFSGYIAAKISESDIGFFDVIRCTLNIIGVIAITQFVSAITGTYKISFLVYVIPLIIYVACLLIVLPMTKTIMF